MANNIMKVDSLLVVGVREGEQPVEQNQQTQHNVSYSLIESTIVRDLNGYRA